MLETLGKQSTVPPFIMPERVARTPSSEAITDYTGSGPFRFVLDEFSPGVKVAYAKFDKYVPRNEPANWMAGGKVVKVDLDALQGWANRDAFDPKDGRVLKVCDTMAAFIEAHTSIRNGITSPHLQEAQARLRAEHRKVVLGPLHVGALFADFD